MSQLFGRSRRTLAVPSVDEMALPRRRHGRRSCFDRSSPTSREVLRSRPHRRTRTSSSRCGCGPRAAGHQGATRRSSRVRSARRLRCHGQRRESKGCGRRVSLDELREALLPARLGEPAVRVIGPPGDIAAAAPLASTAHDSTSADQGTPDSWAERRSASAVRCGEGVCPATQDERLGTAGH